MLHQLRCSTQDVVVHSFLELKARCALGNWRSPTGIMVSGELFTIQFNPKGPVINCEQNPNAETDAAINLEHECKKPGGGVAMMLEPSCISVIAGAGYGEAPTVDIAA